MKNSFYQLFLMLPVLLISSCKQQENKIVMDVYQKWHTITRSFQGPETSESAKENPFLNFRLRVNFKHGDSQYQVRGFYAADGNAENTSAEKGNVWQVRFTPDHEGEWEYFAELEHGDSIALSDNSDGTKSIAIKNAKGKFKVIASDKKGKDFRAHGRLVASNGHFRFGKTGDYWLKGGANSPENLLAYSDFDGTYRMEASSRKGESKTNDIIHSYEPHLKDWEIGNPTWKNGKGKALIGAMNYLASKGMNASYFLTMNIQGDGKDVWPYRTPDDFARFDVSKLAQWEIVFEHMQSKGLLMQIVLQETENEMLLDDGDTGSLRQLYLRELMARFGHHLGLNWNIGEENGPAPFAPIGQNNAQRKAMIDFITKIDPYNHPIVMHTHATDESKKHILDSILGYKNLDGLSFQNGKRENAAEGLERWKKKSRDSGHEWMINMDEIGKWDLGAQTDSLDFNHDSLRGNVLWGTLLSGASGIEWYFGAFTKGNDLNVEDWRSRNHLWELTKYTLDFFNNNLPYWDMQPNHKLAMAKEAFCLRKEGLVYAFYFPLAKEHKADLRETKRTFTLQWFDPMRGGELQTGSVKTIQGGSIIDLGLPPSQKINDQDWVVLLKP